jgi:hypothetical protein
MLAAPIYPSRMTDFLAVVLVRADATSVLLSDSNPGDAQARMSVWQTSGSSSRLKWIGLAAPSLWAGEATRDDNAHWAPLLQYAYELRHNMIRFVYPGNDILSIEHRLGGTVFDGWQYGTPSKHNESQNYQIDCDTFTLIGVESYLGRALSEKERSFFLLGFNDAEDQQIKAAKGDKAKNKIKQQIISQWIDTNDVREQGLALALADDLNVATRVASLSDALPGDLIQYWVHGINGIWSGHAAIIDFISKHGDRYDVLLYSSQARPAPGGVGEFLVSFGNPDTNPKYRIFIVRLK